MTLLLFVIAVGLSALYSGLETGLYSTSRLRVFLDGRSGVPMARRLEPLYARLPAVLTVLLVVNNAVNNAAAYYGQKLVAGAGDGGEIDASVVLVSTLLVSVVLFLFGEALPKSVFRRWREHALYPAAPALLLADVALRRVVSPLTVLSSWIARHWGGASGATGVVDAEADREQDVSIGAAEGVLNAFQERVARGVLDLRATDAAHAARPLEEHPIARIGRPGATIPEGVRDHRVLVLDEAGDRAVGWVYLASLYPEGRPRAPTRRACRPLTRVAADVSLDRVYAALDRVRTPFAVVREVPETRVVDVERLRLTLIGAATPERGAG